MPTPITEADLLKLWSDLIRNPDVHWPDTPLQPALDMFSGATRAFAANANRGTVILCRSAIEAACFVYLIYSASRRSKAGWTIDFPLGLDGKWRDIPWGEIKGGIVRAGILSNSQLENMERIREDGNAAAHLMQTYMKRVHRAAQGIPVKRGGGSPWILQSEVWRDLQDTARILERLCVAMYNKR